jgi:transcriptional regulator with XRE-family HTH domain
MPKKNPPESRATNNDDAAPGDEFAKLLRDRRLGAGSVNPKTGEARPLSYRELAERTGGAVSFNMIAGMENGYRRPLRDPERIRALAEGLANVSYEELMEAAGYQRPTGPLGRDLAHVLADMGLTEAEIDEVEHFVEFVIGRRPTKR